MRGREMRWDNHGSQRGTRGDAVPGRAALRVDLSARSAHGAGQRRVPRCDTASLSAAPRPPGLPPHRGLSRTAFSAAHRSEPPPRGADTPPRRTQGPSSAPPRGLRPHPRRAEADPDPNPLKAPALTAHAARCSAPRCRSLPSRGRPARPPAPRSRGRTARMRTARVVIGPRRSLRPAPPWDVARRGMAAPGRNVGVRHAEPLPSCRRGTGSRQRNGNRMTQHSHVARLLLLLPGFITAPIEKGIKGP